MLLVVLLVTWSNYLSAYEKFTGSITGSVIEANGHVFTGGQGYQSDEFEDKQVVYFRQERGQKITMTKNNIVFDSSKSANSIIWSWKITERKDDKFKALVNFYQNQIVNEKNDYSALPK